MDNLLPINDNYLPCSAYLGNTIDQNGFYRFEHEGQWYFSFIENDAVVLRSEGYTTEAGRENGINSVIKNLPLEERYATIQLADRTWVLSLKAGNHQEIAQSCPVASEEAAKAFLPSERAKAAEQRRLAALATANNQNNNEDTDRLDDDYMVCSVYESFINEKHPEYDDFISFYEEDTQKYYFAWINPDTKTIILRSEGYPTTAARNNGLESVRKNREIRERFKIEEKRNLYYLVLKAGNHQEIGRSCPQKTEAAAWALLDKPEAKPDRLDDDYMVCSVYESFINEKHPEYDDFISFYEEDTQKYYFAWINPDTKTIILRSEGYPTTAARNNGLESVRKNREIRERFKIEEKRNLYYLVLKAGNHQEIGRSCPHKTEAAAWALLDKPEAKPDRLDDDYMVCSVYESFINEKHPEYDDFISFYEEDTQKILFCLDKSDTKTIILRSEGYLTTAARNNGLESVRKNREIRERFKIEEKRNLYYLVLKAGNHQEIGRSCPHKTEAIAWAILPLLPIIPDILPEPEPIEAIILPVVIPEPEPIAEIIPPVVIPEPEPEPVAIAAPPVIPVIPKKKDVEDDYLPCSEYKNKPISDKRNNAALFKHKNGQYYFAIYNKEGSVRLRSEGFKTAKDRDRELSGVLRYMNDKTMYTTIEENGHTIKVLKDKTGREVARTCPEMVAAAILPVVVAPAITPPPPVITPVAPVVPPPAAPFAPIATGETATAAATATASGFNWKWLLLLLPLLLGLFFLWRSCQGDKTAAVATKPTNTTTATTTTPPPPATTATSTNIAAADTANQKSAETASNAAAAASTNDTKQAETPAAVTPNCDLHWILFDYDKFDIKTDAKQELQKMAAILKKNPTYIAELRAFTDARGSDDYNKNLSKNRAKAAKNVLLEAGVKTGNIKTSSFSKDKPIAENTDDDSGRKFNRRVELYIKDAKGKDVCQSIVPDIPNNLKK
ncbi:MAG: DUF1508 domain-containing protein [Sphingobacteriales bacterium]|nr:DUF1508 domain-containing protein [Sphingobacteriales bacterium]